MLSGLGTQAAGLCSEADTARSLREAVARRSTSGGELARFSHEFPHNRFRVAPIGEAAVSDVASASALVSVGVLVSASPLLWP
jgi:hypothetical protein